MLAQLIVENKNNIIKNAINWMKNNHPIRTMRYNKCERDLTLVLNAYILDLTENTNCNTKFIGGTFWKGGVREIKNFEVELAVQDFIVNYIINELSNNTESNDKLVKLKDNLKYIIEFGPEKSILDVINKRKHVYEYKDDDIPDLSAVREILLKTWYITPSKQNIMPYSINVLGPNATIIKEKIYNKVVGNDRQMSVEGLSEGAVLQLSTEINPYYRHILHNPYLIVFSQRVCTDKDINPFYRRKISEGQFMEQASENWVDRIKSSTSIEVGLFAQNLANLCLEQGIDSAFTSCFPGDIKKWKDIDFVEHPVLLLMSLGKAKIYRRDLLDQTNSDNDYKTAFDNVVKFVG